MKLNSTRHGLSFIQLLPGLGGGGGGGPINNSRLKMTKEAMMEDLVKRSADSSAVSQAAIETPGAAAGEPIWKEAGGGFELNLGKLI